MSMRLTSTPIRLGNPKSALRAALEKLDEALVGRRFLVEDRFSRADLTACALLRRSCMPDETSVDIHELCASYATS